MIAPLFDPAQLGLPASERPPADPLEAALETLARDPAQVDPLRRLFDPAFTATAWEYEGSRLDSAWLPGKLHRKQLEAIAWDGRFKFLFWGNQVGKTTLGAVEVVLYCLGRHPMQTAGLRPRGPQTWWASALTWELWQDILLPELLTWIPADRLVRAPEPYRQSNNRTIVLRGDQGQISRITGKAAEQGAARYQSKRLHGVWLDEEHPEAVFDELQPRLLRFGGILINTMTPLKGLTWVFHRIYEPWKAGKLPDTFISHAGLRDNPSITEESIAALERMLAHNPSQLAARLHGIFVKPSGLVLKYDESAHRRRIAYKDAQALVRQRRARVFGGVDFGAWRFAFVLVLVDEAGVVYLLDELFMQGGSYGDTLDAAGAVAVPGRARRIHELLRAWLVPPEQFLGIGDCANPQDIIELNFALIKIGSPYRFGAVHANNKIIAAGVDRINSLLGDGRFVVRAGLTSGTWYVNRKSDSDGHPIEGSRWEWEANNWRYPKGKEDRAQDDTPDDHTADGADMMAATRYVVMTHFAGEGPRHTPRHPSVAEVEAAIRRGDDPPEYQPAEEVLSTEHWDTVDEG